MVQGTGTEEDPLQNPTPEEATEVLAKNSMRATPDDPFKGITFPKGMAAPDVSQLKPDARAYFASQDRNTLQNTINQKWEETQKNASWLEKAGAKSSTLVGSRFEKDFEKARDEKLKNDPKGFETEKKKVEETVKANQEYNKKIEESLNKSNQTQQELNIPSKTASKEQTSVTPTKQGEKPVLSYAKDGTVDPNSLYKVLVDRFSNSPLKGTIPKDGKDWGITSGSPHEYARVALALAMQESSLNPNERGGGLYQFKSGDLANYGVKGNVNDPNAQVEAMARVFEKFIQRDGYVRIHDPSKISTNSGWGGPAAYFEPIRIPSELKDRWAGANAVAGKNADFAASEQVASADSSKQEDSNKTGTPKQPTDNNKVKSIAEMARDFADRKANITAKAGSYQEYEQFKEQFTTWAKDKGIKENDINSYFDIVESRRTDATKVQPEGTKPETTPNLGETKLFDFKVDWEKLNKERPTNETGRIDFNIEGKKLEGATFGSGGHTYHDNVIHPGIMYGVYTMGSEEVSNLGRIHRLGAQNDAGRVFGGNQGSDPKFGKDRSGMVMHSVGTDLKTAGCVGISRKDFPAFMQTLQELQKDPKIGPLSIIHTPAGITVVTEDVAKQAREDFKNNRMPVGSKEYQEWMNSISRDGKGGDNLKRTETSSVTDPNKNKKDNVLILPGVDNPKTDQQKEALIKRAKLEHPDANIIFIDKHTGSEQLKDAKVALDELKKNGGTLSQVYGYSLGAGTALNLDSEGVLGNAKINFIGATGSTQAKIDSIKSDRYSSNYDKESSTGHYDLPNVLADKAEKESNKQKETDATKINDQEKQTTQKTYVNEGKLNYQKLNDPRVDPFIKEGIIEGAKKAFGDPNDPHTRYEVRINGAYADRAGKHHEGEAVDLQIYDRETKRYIGTGKDDIFMNAYGNPMTYPMYQALARGGLQALTEKYGPEVANQFSWGGNFFAKQGIKGGAAVYGGAELGGGLDEMHYSRNEKGNQGSILGGPSKNVQQWLDKYGVKAEGKIDDITKWKSPYLPQSTEAQPAPDLTGKSTGGAPQGGGITEESQRKQATLEPPTSQPIEPVPSDAGAAGRGGAPEGGAITQESQKAPQTSIMGEKFDQTKLDDLSRGGAPGTIVTGSKKMIDELDAKTTNRSEGDSRPTLQNPKEQDIPRTLADGNHPETHPPQPGSRGMGAQGRCFV